MWGPRNTSFQKKRAKEPLKHCLQCVFNNSKIVYSFMDKHNSFITLLWIHCKKTQFLHENLSLVPWVFFHYQTNSILPKQIKWERGEVANICRQAGAIKSWSKHISKWFSKFADFDVCVCLTLLMGCYLQSEFHTLVPWENSIPSRWTIIWLIINTWHYTMGIMPCLMVSEAVSHVLSSLTLPPVPWTRHGRFHQPHPADGKVTLVESG